MRKVISFMLAVVMIFSVFAVLPTVSAAETIYKAGTEVKVLWGFSHVNEFCGAEVYINYGDSLEYIPGSVSSPHIKDAYLYDENPGEYCAIISSLTPYDISSDHVVLTANFIVKEDVSEIDVVAYVGDLYLVDGSEFIDIDDWTNEFTFEVISVPTEPTEDTTPSEEPSEDTTPSEEPSEDTTPTEDTTPSEEPSEELKNGIYEEDGKLYYYKDGAKNYAGLILIDGDYYYVNSSCIVVTGKKYSISKTNYLLPRDVYEFDETGKMVNPPVKETTQATETPDVKNGIFEEDGVLYYYKDNAKFYAGLVMIDGYYYYVNSSCKVIAGKTYYVSKTNNLLPSASYTFGLDGKMLNSPVEETTEPPTEDSGVKNGFVVENGVTYYYVDGVKTYAGLIEIDGDIYYVNSSCKVIMGKAYYVSKTNNLKERGTYTFDATGKMVIE